MTILYRVKRLMCKLAGHVPHPDFTTTPTGFEARWITCRRCGALLDWEEVPTHV